MAEGRQREAWNHTASIVAAVLNTDALRDRVQGWKSVSAAELHPFAEAQPESAERVSVASMKGLFKKGNSP